MSLKPEELKETELDVLRDIRALLEQILCNTTSGIPQDQYKIPEPNGN